MKRLVVALLVVFTAGVAHAHPLDIGYLRIESRGDTLVVEFDLQAELALKLSHGSDTASALADATYRRAPIVTDRGECRWLTATTTLRAQTNTRAQTGEAICPNGASSLTWSLPVFDDVPATFQLFVKARPFGHEVITILGSNARTLEVAGDATAFGGFVWSGIEHIGAAPGEWHDANGWKLADGLDHVAFLIALLLGGGTLLQLLGIATGFTVGHSITLGLATLGIVQLPASVIEPLVALTIVATATEAYTGTLQRYRWAIAMGFGLIHGFAFASALGGAGLAKSSAATVLFGFNLGVELGQAAIILLVAPWILALYRYWPRQTRIGTKVIAALIACAGVYWFFERIGG